MIRNAACSCGQLTAEVNGEPLRIAICHCIACQRRTGSPFSAQARFNKSEVTTSGSSHSYARVADSGNRLTFHFCPTCAAIVYYFNTAWPDAIGVPLGVFDDPQGLVPKISVYERSKHPWFTLPNTEMAHND
jgi:hypothetical protein